MLGIIPAPSHHNHSLAIGPIFGVHLTLPFRNEIQGFFLCPNPTGQLGATGEIGSGFASIKGSVD